MLTTFDVVPDLTQPPPPSPQWVAVASVIGAVALIGLWVMAWWRQRQDVRDQLDESAAALGLERMKGETNRALARRIRARHDAIMLAERAEEAFGR
jgi:hypothetical protein